MVITNNKKPTTSTFGNVGDYYINTSANTVYKCVDKDCEPSKYQFVDINVDCCPDHIKYSWKNYDKIIITNCYNFCYMGARLDMIDRIDTSNAIFFNDMFREASEITSIPRIDTSKGVSFTNMFAECTALTSIPELDTSNGEEFYYMFAGCSSLKSIPELDTSKGAYFDSMFSGCSSLKSIPKLDFSNAVSARNIFSECSALESIRLYNIRADIQIGSNKKGYGTLLDVDSLVHTIKELCKVDTAKTLTMSTASRDKIADLYCKVIDDSTEKIEMELCNSTDSGAMTLSAYAGLKNWTIAYE